MASRTFVLPTSFVAHDLAQFREMLGAISLESLYYHIFDARLRLGREENDFSRWLRGTVAGRISPGRRLFLLDYDGTLVGFHERPRLASPTSEVLRVLECLSGDRRNTVAIVSGRDRDTLGEFFGGLGLTPVAEHGVWLRDPGTEWRTTKKISSSWKPDLLPILQLYTDRLPGALIEEKGAAIAWHYRKADPEQAQVLVGELMDHLTSFTANTDLQIMQGNKVMEIRSAGVNKGTAVAALLQRAMYDFILPVGDDWTDEDVFQMPPPSV